MADISKIILPSGDEYNLKDSSVPAWAKTSTKPSYTATELGIDLDQYALKNSLTDYCKEASIIIATTDWSASAPYTYTWTSNLVTNTCKVLVSFALNPREYYTGDLLYDKVSGGVQFTTDVKPTQQLSLTINIIDTSINNANSSGTSGVNDVQINHTSIVDTGIANIPFGNGTPGVVQGQSSLGTYVDPSNGLITVSKARDDQVKEGTNVYKPITPYSQHLSTFYGLAKAAGLDMSTSTNNVGEYTDAAKVAIQKMLGIYQAPFELINTQTITNATVDDIIITVDSNNQPFELTDIVLQVILTQSENDSSAGSYGRIQAFYTDTEHNDVLLNSITRAGGDNAKAGYAIFEQNGNVLKSTAGTWVTLRDNTPLRWYTTQLTATGSELRPFVILTEPQYYNKIVIRQITGELQYFLYGKRRWT